MGVVWLAEQREPIRRSVALKLIAPEIAGPGTVARFRNERQALARMSHPAVARVFDAGATDDGTPYFAMEYVEGRRVTDYCDQHRLTLRQRLELFAVVCDAVHHAHQKGVIHRDIKPDNVLVASRDGRHHPIVIDFGIAKAIEEPLSDDPHRTSVGTLVGTPAYMSPEQAEGSADVDAQSDVYSLGVLLYELLAGIPPFGHERFRDRSPMECRRIVVEESPPTPSARLAGLPTARTAHADDSAVQQGSDAPSRFSLASAPEVASARRTTPRELRACLRRELEWIPLKAMHKERALRYGSAAQLADDVRNYLAGLPLVAGPESAGYRLRKFVRRNRGAVFASGAIVLGLAAGLLVAILALRVAQERGNEAEIARRNAEAVNDFVLTSLGSADPYLGGSKDATVRDAMRVAIVEIAAGRFSADPTIEATLKDMIASVLVRNGDPAGAIPLFEASLATWKELLGRTAQGDDPKIATSMAGLATAWEDVARLSEAEPLHAQVLEMRRRLWQGDHPEIALGLNDLARCKNRLGKSREAEALYEQALAMRRRLFPGDSAMVALSLSNLGVARQEANRLEEAESLHQESLDMRRRLFQGDNPWVASSLSNLASVKSRRRQYDDAARLHQEALGMRKRLFQGDHPQIAMSLNNCGTANMSLNRFAEAEPYLQESLAMRRRLFPGDHPETAESMGNLAFLKTSTGKLEEADDLSEQTLAMQRNLYSGDHRSVALALSNLANTKFRRGLVNEAEPLAREALEMRSRMLADHPEVARSLRLLAEIQLERNEMAEALGLATKAVEMGERVWPADHPQLAACRETLGRCTDKEKAKAEHVPQ